jgi:hypothetical protein
VELSVQKAVVNVMEDGILWWIVQWGLGWIHPGEFGEE